MIIMEKFRIIDTGNVTCSLTISINNAFNLVNTLVAISIESNDTVFFINGICFCENSYCI